MNWQRMIPTRQSLMASRWLGWLSPWIGHPKLWHFSRRGVALGVALGTFFGLLIPLGQIPVTTVAAVVLRANLPAAAASTLISNPVTFAPIYYAAFQAGTWLTGEASQPIDAQDQRGLSEQDGQTLQRIRALGKPLLVGLSIMACLSGLLTYLLTTVFWRWRTVKRWRNRGKIG